MMEATDSATIRCNERATGAAWLRRETLGASLCSTVLLLLVCRFLIGSAYNGAMNSSGASEGSDFKSFFWAAQRLDRGERLYPLDRTTFHFGYGYGYVYPPLIAVALKPLAHLQDPFAFRIWTWTEIICLIASACLCASSMRLTINRSLAIALMLVTGFRFWPTTLHFALGQSNLFMLLFLSAATTAAARQRMVLAALFIAIAALCKPWMLGLAIFFALCRSWRGLLACPLFFGLGIAILFTYIGWKNFPDFISTTRLASNQTGQIAFSIPGIASGYFGRGEFVHPIIDSPTIRRMVTVLGYAVLGSALLLVGRRASAERNSPRHELLLGILMVSLLLALPVCHVEYSVLCLPLLWNLILSASAKGDGPSNIRNSLLGIGIYLLFTVSWPIFSSDPKYRHGIRSVEMYSYFFIFVGLWFSALCAFNCSRGSDSRLEGRYGA